MHVVQRVDHAAEHRREGGVTGCGDGLRAKYVANAVPVDVLELEHRVVPVELRPEFIEQRAAVGGGIRPKHDAARHDRGARESGERSEQRSFHGARPKRSNIAAPKRFSMAANP